MDEIIDAIITQLRTDMGASYTYVYGNYVQPPQSKLPMICVYPIATTRDILGTGGSNKAYMVIEVKVWLDLKDYIDQSTESGVIQHVKATVQVMERRDPLTSSPVVSSVLGSLEYFSFNNHIVDQMMPLEVSYTEIAQLTEGSYLVPVVIRLTMTQLLPRCPT